MLVDELAAHKPVTTEQADTYATQRESAILAQRTEHRRLEEEKKARALELYADKIGKKQKQREEKKKLMELEKEKLAETAAGGNERLELFVPNVAEGETTTGPPPSQTHNVHKRSQQPLSSTPYTIIIQPSSADMPWYDSSAPDVVKATLEEARECGLWHYPTDALQSARCRVFEDLWRQGYFMGGGLRFGGDFLVYPGEKAAVMDQRWMPRLTTGRPAPQVTRCDITHISRSRFCLHHKHLSCRSTWSRTVVSPQRSRRRTCSRAGMKKRRKRSISHSNGLPLAETRQETGLQSLSKYCCRIACTMRVERMYVCARRLGAKL